MLKLDNAGRLRDGSDDYGIRVEFPNGKRILIRVPDFEKDRFRWLCIEDGDSFGINLVTEGHYT